MKKNRDLAKKLKKNMGYDPADCRNIVIWLDGLCESAEGVEIIEKALDLYINTPVERLERLTIEKRI